MLYTKAQIEEKAEDSFTAIASSEVTDRQGEIVQQSGWDLKNYKNNPILLLQHDHTMPLGKATRVWIDKTGSKPLLKFKGMISTATDYGKAAKQLMQEGILNSFSVGFRANEMDGNVITKAELFEISLVSIPANPEARVIMAKSLQDKGFEQSFIKQFTGEDNAEEEKDEVAELREEIAQLKEQAAKTQELAEAAVKGLQHLAPQRSKHEIVSKRLQQSKMIAKAADRLIVESKSPKTVSKAKIMKRASEKLIRELKGDL